MFSAEPRPLAPSQLHQFLGTLATMVQSHSPNKHDVGVQCLEALLARPECRQAVWAIPGIIAGCGFTWASVVVVLMTLSASRLVEILKHKQGPQMCYQVAFCFWLLTFEQNIAEEINKFVLLWTFNRCADWKFLESLTLFPCSLTLLKMP